MKYNAIKKVWKDYFCNYITKNGTLLFNKWYSHIEYNEELDSFFVKDREKYNLIDWQENIIMKDVIKYIHKEKTFLAISEEHLYNLKDKKGKFLLLEWYKEIEYLEEINLYKVKTIDNYYNIISEDGILMSNINFDYIGDDYNYNIID